MGLDMIPWARLCICSSLANVVPTPESPSLVAIVALCPDAFTVGSVGHPRWPTLSLSLSLSLGLSLSPLYTLFSPHPTSFPPPLSPCIHITDNGINAPSGSYECMYPLTSHGLPLPYTHTHEYTFLHLTHPRSHRIRRPRHHST